MVLSQCVVYLDGRRSFDKPLSSSPGKPWIIISGPPEVGVGGGVLTDSPRLLLSDKVSDSESSKIPLLLQKFTRQIILPLKHLQKN